MSTQPRRATQRTSARRATRGQHAGHNFRSSSILSAGERSDVSRGARALAGTDRFLSLNDQPPSRKRRASPRSNERTSVVTILPMPRQYPRTHGARDRSGQIVEVGAVRVAGIGKSSNPGRMMSEITLGTRRRKISRAPNALAPFALSLLASMGCSVPEPDPVGGSGNAGTPSGGTSAGSNTGGSSSGGTAGVSTGGVAGSSGSSGSAGSLDCSSPRVGGSPLRRLTRREYNNVVRDLWATRLGRRSSSFRRARSRGSRTVPRARSSARSSSTTSSEQRRHSPGKQPHREARRSRGLRPERSGGAGCLRGEVHSRLRRPRIPASARRRSRLPTIRRFYTSRKRRTGFPSQSSSAPRDLAVALLPLSARVRCAGRRRRDGRCAHPGGNGRATLVPACGATSRMRS